ncbi:hypothetical protein RJP21_16060 [Paenibacillus sp. VCA1]|uniref:hypothetical protein n=1 Tax=Paenibacillus sp. VCA1 TaxID=3039148 RepID=UPI002872781C|nr:hypothetical protein [Paenibacillus sp. VCA1]MDR9855132.1 hypothetical protein [Paenibacillus sp. VCA1]
MAQTESSQGMIRWLGSIGIINHVMIFPLLLQTAGKDSWIAVIDPAVPLMFVATMGLLRFQSDRE